MRRRRHLGWSQNMGQDQGLYELNDENRGERQGVDGTIWQSYQTNVEIFIALRDVDYQYSVDNNTPMKSPIKNLARKVVAHCKPPGSLQWVEKCVTETVFREKSPKFATKLYFQCETQDASNIVLRFDIHDSSSPIGRFQQLFTNTLSCATSCSTSTILPPSTSKTPLLGSVEVNLESIINAKSTGIELPILSLIEPYRAKTTQPNRRRSFTRKNSKINPGRLFLRAELLKPMDYAVLLKFGLRINTGRWCFLRKPIFPFYFEIYKLNPETMFEISYPYTLLYRSELIKYTGVHEDDCWNYIVIPVSRVCNGDLGRVLKLEIYQTDRPNTSQGFALTTLRKMLIDRELVIPVSKHDGKVSQRLCLYAPLCHEVPLHPMQYYVNKGLAIRRLFAVDYSSSNWNVQSHLRPLHEAPAEGRSSYEEAIIMTAGAMIEIAQGDSIFYSFGNINTTSYVTRFGPDNHIHALLRNYREALSGVQYAMECNKISNNVAKYNYVTGTSSNPVTPSKRSTHNSSTPSTMLSPFLTDLITLLTESSEKFEYQVVFIFTDGQIGDVEESMQVILSLAQLPVSLIFIGIGMGDFQSLLKLEQDWTHPRTGEFPCRKIIHVIHFRNLLEWDSSIHFTNYTSSPPDLFRKEILTTIRDQMPAYMRIYRTAI